MAAFPQTGADTLLSEDNELLALTSLLEGNREMATLTCFLLLETSLTLILQIFFSSEFSLKTENGFSFFIGRGIFSQGFHYTQTSCLHF